MAKGYDIVLTEEQVKQVMRMYHLLMSDFDMEGIDRLYVDMNGLINFNQLRKDAAEQQATEYTSADFESTIIGWVLQALNYEDAPEMEAVYSEPSEDGQTWEWKEKTSDDNS